jgi:hypothetical protein
MNLTKPLEDSNLSSFHKSEYFLWIFQFFHSFLSLTLREYNVWKWVWQQRHDDADWKVNDYNNYNGVRMEVAKLE